MNQLNALRRLETILDEAIRHGNKSEFCGQVLLKAMKVNEQPENFLNFYELLAEAYAEAEKLRHMPRIERQLITLQELKALFITSHPWGIAWDRLYNNSLIMRSLDVLDSLAMEMHRLNPQITLDEDFLKQLSSDFESLLNQITDSELPQQLKDILNSRIADILQAIRRYHISGSKGLGNIPKAALLDLAIQENKLTKEEKKNVALQRYKAMMVLLTNFFRPNFYDVAGLAFNGIQLQTYLAVKPEIEQIVSNEESDSIEKIFQKASAILSEKETKSITGIKTPPALAPALQNLGDNADCETNP